MEVVRTDRGQDLMDEIRNVVRQITEESHERLTKYDRQIVGLSRRATLWSILGNVLAAVLFVAVLRRAFRERTRVEDAEKTRIETFKQTDGKIEALGQQAGELARSFESLRIQATTQPEGEAGSLAHEPRDVSDEIEALGEQAASWLVPWKRRES